MNWIQNNITKLKNATESIFETFISKLKLSSISVKYLPKLKNIDWQLRKELQILQGNCGNNYSPQRFCFKRVSIKGEDG
jgi:hypothetical protein